jgi:hypothetical protein
MVTTLNNSASKNKPKINCCRSSLNLDFSKLPYIAHFLKNDDEILPAHFAWKVVEKGLKIK